MSGAARPNANAGHLRVLRELRAGDCDHDEDVYVAALDAAIEALAQGGGAAAQTPPAAPIVRFNDDGTLDEIVGTGQFHLEQMSATHWWMQLGPHMVNLHSRCLVKANFAENEAQ